MYPTGMGGNTSYREPLPRGCPPEDAQEIVASRTVFRLVRANPPSEEDFRSHRAERPNARFHNVGECRARGLSVFSERDACARHTKLPSLRGRIVCRVQLMEGAGRIQQWGHDLAHNTWWPFAAYNILANCAVEGP